MDYNGFIPIVLEAVNELQADNEAIRSNNSALQLDVAALGMDTGALQSDVAALGSDTGALQSEVAALRLDNSALKATVSEHQRITEAQRLQVDYDALASQVYLQTNPTQTTTMLLRLSYI